jgi:Conjugal transfer protein TraD.
MRDVSIDEFLDSIPDVDGINKEKIKKEFNALTEPEEQLTFMQKLYDQAEARLKDLKSRKSKEERAARTRRLIQIGGLVESVMGREYSADDLDILREQLYTMKADSDSSDVCMQIGRIAERVLGRSLRPEDLQLFQNFLLGQEQRGNYYTKAMGS